MSNSIAPDEILKRVIALETELSDVAYCVSRFLKLIRETTLTGDRQADKLRDCKELHHELKQWSDMRMSQRGTTS